MSVTVIIPTAGRPGMLRDSIASVGRQTALHRITCIHVSENAGNPESEAVCKEFSHLPVRYTRREPALAPNDHFIAVVGEITTPFAAILHDDDWWAPHHIEVSLRDLEASPAAAASYSGFFEPYGLSYPLYCDTNFMCWCAAGYPPLAGHWPLSPEEVIVASLPGTPLRYSTLVTPTARLKEAMYIFKLGNPFDTDRLLGVALALQGPILYQPVPSTFIRLHPGQDVRNFDTSARDHHMGKTTRWMLDKLAPDQSGLKELLAARLASCPTDHRPELMRRLSLPLAINGLREKSAVPEELDRFIQRPFRLGKLAPFMQGWIPPVLLDFARRMRQK